MCEMLEDASYMQCVRHAGCMSLMLI